MRRIRKNFHNVFSPPKKTTPSEIDGFVSVPPKRIINENNIEDSGNVQYGTVKFYNESKGFGFIIPENGGQQIFVHVTGLKSEIHERDYVRFEVQNGKKGLNAINVELTSNSFLGSVTISFRVNNAGKIEAIVQEADGTYIYSDGTIRLENNLFTIKTSRWVKILKRLEEIINDVHSKESDLQYFFEEYPDLICGDDYEAPIPQASIVCEEGLKWKVDFLLRPKDQIGFCKLLELKKPDETTFIKSKSGHKNFTAKLIHAINQLKDYAEAFNSEKTREKFYNKYNTEVFKPDLHLVFGRKVNNEKIKDFLELQRRNNVEISDWDTLVDKFKRKFI